MDIWAECQNEMVALGWELANCKDGGNYYERAHLVSLLALA